MDRLTKENPTWIDDEFWILAEEPDEEKIDNIYLKLREYEDTDLTPQEVEQLKAENTEFRKTILELQEEVEFYKANDNVCAITVKGEISEKARKYDEMQAEKTKLEKALLMLLVENENNSREWKASAVSPSVTWYSAVSENDDCIVKDYERIVNQAETALKEMEVNNG